MKRTRSKRRTSRSTVGHRRQGSRRTAPQSPRNLPNKLLANLTPREYELLKPHLEEISLIDRQVLYQPDEEIQYVYFPFGGVVSLLTIMKDGSGVEIATVGNEGMVGTPIVLGALSMHEQALCQIPGDAMRIKSKTLLKQMDRTPNLKRLMSRYMQGLVVQFTQGVACNRLHTIEQRCARWLLMTHDCVNTDTFPLTQEFLAQMLGVRRAGVNEAAGTLQNDGLITYHRGVIKVIDRKGLEAVACECYGVIVDQFEKLFGKGRSRSKPDRNGRNKKSS
jgi:CRP-like cAMP-binding protein